MPLDCERVTSRKQMEGGGPDDHIYICVCQRMHYYCGQTSPNYRSLSVYEGTVQELDYPAVLMRWGLEVFS